MGIPGTATCVDGRRPGSCRLGVARGGRLLPPESSFRPSGCSKTWSDTRESRSAPFLAWAGRWAGVGSGWGGGEGGVAGGTPGPRPWGFGLRIHTYAGLGAVRREALGSDPDRSSSAPLRASVLSSGNEMGVETCLSVLSSVSPERRRGCLPPVGEHAQKPEGAEFRNWLCGFCLHRGCIFMFVSTYFAFICFRSTEVSDPGFENPRDAGITSR